MMYETFGTFRFSRNHNINTYSIDLLNGKCTECFIYHVGAHLKALGILVLILGPESTTGRILLRQSWLLGPVNFFRFQCHSNSK